MYTDNNRYINSETYDICDFPVGYIPCDSEIAYVIAELSKKGYKTLFSCAGHNKISYSETTNEWSIDKIDEIKNNPFFKIIKITNDHVYTKTEDTVTDTYITFDKEYHFDSIPEGFELEYSNVLKKQSLRRWIYFYDENSEFRRDDQEIDKELHEGWDSLRNWVDSLEYINDRVKER